ncbi:MAG: hypothetical protein DCC75_05580 [Proteobacteria bacterium]|nr:MAG: hypothetical protein DCC75_05580 [Pseudomonadota bacterium]
MTSDLPSIAERVSAIEARNRRVELEKAWEVSALRRYSILLLTYFLTLLVFYLIGVERFWLSAIIPTLGYLLSTLSISLLKNWWLTKREF